MPSPVPLPAYVRSFAESVLTLAHLVSAAETPQWQPSRAPKARGDEGDARSIMGKGGHSDPVLAAVSDPKRLRLRAAVVSAEHTLARSSRQLEAAIDELDESLAEWSADARFVRPVSV